MIRALNFLLSCGIFVFALLSSAALAQDGSPPSPHVLELFQITGDGQTDGCGAEFHIIGPYESNGESATVLVKGRLSTVIEGGTSGLVLQVAALDLVADEDTEQQTASLMDISDAHVEGPAGAAYFYEDGRDVCPLEPMDVGGICGIIDDAYTNPVVGALMTGSFSVIFVRANEEDVEVALDPDRVPGHRNYLASIRSCMMNMMQKYKDRS